MTSQRPADAAGMDESALGYSVFFRREYATVARTVNFVVHDEGRAEELTQDAFIQLLRHWKRVSHYDRPEAWVRRVAIRLAIKYVKREHLRVSFERESHLRDPAETPESEVLDSLRTLSPPQRAAIVLHYYEDLPVDEIADIMGCAQNTVKSHLHRGRDKMRHLLTRTGEDVP